MNDILYYEAHVTIEPVFDDRLKQFKELCLASNFKAAELLMKKRKRDLPERSQYDTFCTGRFDDYSIALQQTMALVENLKWFKFKIYRYKIEATLLDVRLKNET